MKSLRPKVLVVTYYFPPAGGSGVQRTLKFIKYLRDFGWEPVVLTARAADYPAYDETLMAEVPVGVKVYRSRIVEPYRWYRKLTGRAADEATDIATLTLDQQAKRRWRERFSEWLRATFFVPDARIGWLFFALPLARKIVGREKITVIFSSAPPYTTHLIGMLLHRSTHLPWVADFRDSWIGWLSTPQWRPRLVRAMEMWMEGSVLRYADRLLTVTKGVQADLLSRHPQLISTNWNFLPNGYDAADFAGVQPVPASNRLVVTYTGSLYGNRNPEFLLQALEQLQQEQPRLAQKIVFRFVGRIGETILQRLRTATVSEMIECIPYVTHRESLAYLLGSNVSLLIIDDAPVNRGILTGKLFEYIGAGNPILALAPVGDAAELIRNHNLGWIVPPKDVPAIRNTLQQILAAHQQGRSWRQPDAGVRQRFERRNLTGELASILNELINNGKKMEKEK